MAASFNKNSYHPRSTTRTREEPKLPHENIIQFAACFGLYLVVATMKI